MKKICSNCQKDFVITEEDLNFYQKISPRLNGKIYEIPTPKLCYECRLQRRLSWRNDMNLFHRKCAFTGENLISMFSDPNLKVYRNDIWWSDQWDPLEYGRDYDFNRHFFAQFSELDHSVPHVNTVAFNSENSLYTNYNGWNKNCYLCSAGNYLEDSLYCYNAQNSKDCIDCLFVWDSENMYQCVQCVACYECFYCLHSKNCHSCMFLDECSSCNDCFMCFNLKNKKYCVLNKQYSREDYQKIKNEMLSKGIEQCFSLWQEERMKFPKRENHNLQTENCRGEYIIQSKNCQDCYIMSKGCEDCRNVFNGFPRLKDSMDCLYCGEDTELTYESIGSGVKSTNMLFCNLCFDGNQNLMYCSYLINCKNCFGCSNLRRKEYCILNKQYTKEEYEELLPRIISHMQQTGEWGEFFDSKISLFPYNETIANLYFPLKEKEEVSPQEKTHHDENLLICAASGKPFKLMPTEIKFYQKWNLPTPKFCYPERHKQRMALMDNWKSFERTCDQCSKKIETNYPPQSPAKIFCEECYLKEVY